MKAFVLICAISIPHGECTKKTASDYRPLPSQLVTNVMACATLGQTMTAPDAPDGAKQYVKIVCQMGERVAAQ